MIQMSPHAVAVKMGRYVHTLTLAKEHSLPNYSHLYFSKTHISVYLAFKSLLSYIFLGCCLRIDAIIIFA